MITFYYSRNNILNPWKSKKYCLKTIVLVAIAIICAVGILATFFAVGSSYQQELFEEYMEDSQSSSKKPQTNTNLPTFKMP